MRGFGGFFPFKIWKHLFVFANFIFPKLDILPALFCAIPNDLLLSRFWQGLVRTEPARAGGKSARTAPAFQPEFPHRGSFPGKMETTVPALPSWQSC